MSVYQQYNLTFRTIYISDWKMNLAKCGINEPAPHLHYMLCTYLNSYNGKGDLYSVAEEVQKVLDNAWSYREDEAETADQHSFVIIRFDLHDGYAYFNEQEYSNPVIKMPLSDFKAILEEWEAFKAANL